MTKENDMKCIYCKKSAGLCQILFDKSKGRYPCCHHCSHGKEWLGI